MKFQEVMYTAEESDMFVQVCVEISLGSLERDVFVILLTVEDGNAIAGVYLAVCTYLCSSEFSTCICSMTAVIFVYVMYNDRSRL